jgi:hypothetical protein
VTEATAVERTQPGDDWTGGTLFTLTDEAQRLYGMDPKRYGPPSARGVLAFVVDVANGRKLPAGSEQLWPEPKESLRTLLRSATAADDQTLPRLPDDPDLIAPSEEFLSEVRSRLGWITWRQSLEHTPTGFALRHHAFIQNHLGFLGVVSLLLLDKRARDLIGRCRYARCGKFFIPPDQPVGRPVERYCSAKHRKAQNDLEAGQRQLVARARRKLEQRYGHAESREAVKRAMAAHPGERRAEQLAEYARALLQARKHK